MPKIDSEHALEHITVFGTRPIDNVSIPPETMVAIQKQLGTALKFDTDKLPLHLLSTEAMNQTAAVLKFGAIKYAEHNWRKGFTWSRPLSAAMRHITAFNDGEDKDPESGLSHLAHAACCIMFLLEFEKTQPQLDDRYKPNLPTTD
ncbi:MAG: dATP/dGTP diphosphohydrolase domain-containing protein [Candidatus Nanopelagicus sp.]